MTDKEFVLSIYPNAFLEKDIGLKYYSWYSLLSDPNHRKLLAYSKGSEIWTCAKVLIEKEIFRKLES